MSALSALPVLSPSQRPTTTPHPRCHPSRFDVFSKATRTTSMRSRRGGYIRSARRSGVHLARSLYESLSVTASDSVVVVGATVHQAVIRHDEGVCRFVNNKHLVDDVL